MKLRIHGAAGEVTGSNYMIETDSFKVLVECGFHQGKDEQKHEGEAFPFDPTSIDALLLTHAHIDHSGRIPLLVKEGFKGKVFCTFATSELVEILWRDSAKIMGEDAQWRTRKNRRKGLPPVEPLYTEKEVEDSLGLLSPVPYDEMIEIMQGLKVRFREAGHILGSSIIETWVSKNNGDKPVKVVFSGDLGPMEGVIEKPPTFIEDADFVLIESTYGDRLHKSLEDTRTEFEDTLKEALKTSAKVLVPTFVVDRAQRVLYEFDRFQKKYPDLKMPKISLDSPMGIKVTEIYGKYIPLLSRELKEMFLKGDDPFEPENFQFTRSADESRALNEEVSGIILAGSGMCSGGRIMHHLKHNLYKPDTHVLFVGYQAQGTLGRRLVDGAKEIRIAGEDVTVKAQLHTLNGFSAHADRNDLLEWAGNFPKKTRFIVVHGEPKSAQALAMGLNDKGYAAQVPALNDTIDLLAPAAEKAVRMPVISQKIIDRLELSPQDIIQLLAAITRQANEMQRLTIETKDYAKIMPLLVSAKTLMETAASIGEDIEKSA
ncbi:MAG: MBL fold metallo-hydrolase [Synergistaceae bacterium]|nr:MBL fold metallo-hydrolase [Synergistaceae bacterium]